MSDIDASELEELLKQQERQMLLQEKAHKKDMSKAIKCECGKHIKKKYLEKHKKSPNHIKTMIIKSSINTNDDDF